MLSYQEFLKEVTSFVPAKTKRYKYCEQRRTIDKMLFLYTTPNSTRKDKEWRVCCFCNEKLDLRLVVSKEYLLEKYKTKKEVILKNLKGIKDKGDLTSEIHYLFDQCLILVNEMIFDIQKLK